MVIETVSIYRVAMPLVYPFRTSFGDTDVVEGVLVKMADGECVGWGEATPWAAPLYSAEWAGGAYAVLRDWLAPAILGQQVDSGDELQEILSPFKGNFFAKSALDLAWWDLEARRRCQPLWRLLGGLSDTAEVGADFGVMESIEALLDAIARAVDAGFTRVKLKIRTGWDVNVLRAVREVFPETMFHVDANSGYRLQDVALFQALDEYRLAMIEQPLGHDDLLDHAQLQKVLRTPICLDESVTSVDRAVQAIELGACRWINIKPGRVGGLTPALRILRAAEKANVPCWIGGMLESSVGSSHCQALATLPNVKYPSDVFPSRRFYAHDLGCFERELSGPSQIRAFEGPGIGCVPDEGRLRASTIESCSLCVDSVSVN